jgi:epoxyqueuosine reductase
MVWILAKRLYLMGSHQSESTIKLHSHSERFSQELHNHWPDWRAWLHQRALELGFSQVRITDTDVGDAHPKLLKWLEGGHHGDMDYMERHKHLRGDPSSLLPGAVRSICLAMPYLSPSADRLETDDAVKDAIDPEIADLLKTEEERLTKPNEAIVSLYARGRDYHKVLRSRLQTLAAEFQAQLQTMLPTHWVATAKSNETAKPVFRVVTDSAPLMEVELARKAGLGWRGKHTLLLNREAGSFFFLGEILINVPLPVDTPVEPHCGTCTVCIDVCPTQAIIAPYQLDARRCISYLTIEHFGAIPVEFRQVMGNRVYGCDDCQLVCPWNKYAKRTTVPDFVERHQLGSSSLLELWSWSETQFTERHAGSAIYRIGYERWRRNLAVALGNALVADLEPKTRKKIREELENALPSASPLVAEHIAWALSQDAPQSNRSLGASL